MCTIVFAYNKHPEYPLIVAANRDEFYSRQTEKASFWDEYPSLLAGRDLQNGGTWLGVTTDGRFSALTNFRDLGNLRKEAPSRGHLVVSTLLHPEPFSNSADHDLSRVDTKLDFQSASVNPASPLHQPEKQSLNALHEIKKTAHLYNGFNLITGTVRQLYYYSNIEHCIKVLQPGIYVMSNELLNSPWPKAERTKARFTEQLSKNQLDDDSLFSLMADPQTFPIEILPKTGLSDEMEVLLSSTFIHTGDYGTRNTTVIKTDTLGNVHFAEKTYKGGIPEETTVYRFSITDNRSFER